MLLLMLMPKRNLDDKPDRGQKREDAFLRDHGGPASRLTFLCFDAISDLIIRLQNVLAKRQR